MMIHRLQNEYAWVTGVGVGRPAKTEWEKQEQMTKYKDILDRQMQDKVGLSLIFRPISRQKLSKIRSSIRTCINKQVKSFRIRIKSFSSTRR
jgi:hypothetical protein